MNKGHEKSKVFPMFTCENGNISNHAILFEKYDTTIKRAAARIFTFTHIEP